MTEWKLLDALADDDRRRLLSLARRRRFAKGEVIFHEGDPGDTLHLVASGRVAVGVASALGEQTYLRLIGAGGWFGELALLAPGPRNATIVALEPVDTLVLHRSQLSELRLRVADLEQVITESLVAEVRRLSSALLEALFVPADRRIARQLAILGEEYRCGEAPASIPLTQEDVARFAGTTRPTVNRVLQELAADGLLRLHRGRIEVMDIKRLARRG